MSQIEVLKCLINLGGSADYETLLREYNKIHFQNNDNFKTIPRKDVKKTMQGDTAKLVRDRVITKTIKQLRNPSGVKIFPTQLEVTFKITKYGIEVARRYKLPELINK